MVKTPFVELTLTSGKVVRVYPVNRYLVNMAIASIKKPDVPMRKINPEAALPGITDEQLLPDPENPEYQEKLAEYKTAMTNKFVDVRLAYGLRDENPPANWPTAEDVKMWKALGIEPVIPEDDYGKKLAWLKYDLLNAGSDFDMVLATIAVYDDLPKEEIDQIIDSFRNNGK